MAWGNMGHSSSWWTGQIAATLIGVWLMVELEAASIGIAFIFALCVLVDIREILERSKI